MDASNSPPGSLGLVYSSSAGGHRGPYVKLFASLLGFEGLCQPAGVATLQRLIAAPRLVLATFDDDLPMFTPAVAIRAVLGRPTVGIFLSPQRCFVTSELKCRLKKIAFKVYRRVPWLTLVTITPFDIEPRYAEVANLGAHDPQYWDLHDGTQIVHPPPSGLSREIVEEARGRAVLCLPGSLSHEKGFGFLADTLAADPGLAQRLLVVAAGKVLPNARGSVERFTSHGGKLVDRRLEDAEIESLYTVADAIWCCYAPGYDQASGVFGRAMQLGVPVVIRSGTLIEAVASGTSLPVLVGEFGDAARMAKLLSLPLPGRLKGAELSLHGERIQSWRQHFIHVVENALSGRAAP